MKTLKLTFFGAAVVLVAVALTIFLASSPVQVQAQQPAVTVDPTDIGGVVTSSKGPEAGAWVIAETTDLPTRYSKTVVTDDRGRYLIPDLPKANYTVWARGYGLVDSAKTQSVPGKIVNITAIIAPNAAAAAAFYPANYWYALLQLPAKSEFPGTGPNGNGINPNMRSQAEWIHQIKTDSCESCHQLGTKATRTLPTNIGAFDSPAQAWARRVQSGQAGSMMTNGLNQLGAPRATAMFGDWTTRIANGELPKEAPPRPQGVERNVVITQWDWADPKAYLHDEIATDKRNPTVNANGPLYGSPEESRDYLPVLEPATNTISRIQVPYRDPNTPGQPKPLQPSPFWGDEAIWDSHITVHNPMLDEKARVWFTSRVGVSENPAFCKEGSSNPSAKVFPLASSGRHLAVYDPKTKKVDLIRTCFSTHHLQFAEDANNTLWTSSGGGGGAVGWLNVKMWDQTHDEEKSQGWTPVILDTNGNGKRDAYTEPNQPADPTKDRRLNIGLYGVTVSPKDGSIWGTVLGFPGAVVRVVPGADPTHTALSGILRSSVEHSRR